MNRRISTIELTYSRVWSRKKISATARDMSVLRDMCHILGSLKERILDFVYLSSLLSRNKK